MANVKAILGEKLGMTQVFTDEGSAIPVTVVQAGPCVVAQIRTPDRDGYATMVYAVVEPTCGEVVLTNAGHPPPLLVGRGGSARFLTDTLDPPLGAPRAPTSPEVGRTHLWPGDTLVLYTDGLIERRTRDIGAGLDGLAALASRFAGASLEELCARLLCMAFDASDPPDDLTVILLRLRCLPSLPLPKLLPEFP